MPPPELKNTGTDYARITTSLLDYGVWVLAHHPSYAALSHFVTAGTGVAKSYRSDIEVLNRLHLRYVESTNGPFEVTVLSTTHDAASLRVVQHLVREASVNPDGTEHDGVPTTATTYNVLIVKQSNEHWYLASIEAKSRAAS